MEERITVRLSTELVAFVDVLMARGEADSRTAVIVRALERERRGELAVRDAAILGCGGADADLDSLAEYAAGIPLDLCRLPH